MGTALRTMWEECPAVSRLLCAGYPLLSIGMPMIAKLVPSAPAMFLCCLFTVLQRHYVWALFASMFYRPITHALSVFTMLVEVYLGLACLPERERDLGSCRFLVWALLVTIVVNLCFLAMMFLLDATVGPGHQFWLNSNQGLWPLVIVCITLRSLASPRDPVGVFGMFFVPSRWYPLVLAGLLSLLSGSILWDVLAALAVGYAHDSLRLDRLILSPLRASTLERSCLCGGARKALSCLGSWVPAQAARGYDELLDGSSSGRRFATLSDLRNAGARRVVGSSSATDLPLFGGQEPDSFRVFGGSGQRLGQ
ncbi:unnamed protein product [Polarella glacialis]|uniref:Derlin n=1 Tax=Polarella glacialis TaxID=89957 RepID=A0A813K5T8_POLGL|nr:unnamed protein product [Polarella glacialis]CAE8697894.1 unnamed protein product [Polarella glacialis]